MAGHWSRLECETIVDDYLQMLSLECRQIPYSKSEHRGLLREKLDGRSDGSIEYKHQNISAALIRAGSIYISGYKPAWNYQSLLGQVVLARLEGQHSSIVDSEKSLIELDVVSPEFDDFKSLVVLPPERTPEKEVRDRRTRVPRIINYAEREARNRHLGRRGEEFVIALERNRLSAIGRKDLVADVEWTSQEKGDGTGYDIRSFDGETDDPLYIEVKTTNSGKYQPFMISAGEVSFSSEYSSQFAIYRVFQFSRSPNVFILPGAVDNHVHLNATAFRATF